MRIHLLNACVLRNNLASYTLGDKVWIRNHQIVMGLSTKILPTWIGPYEIRQRNSTVKYTVVSCTDERDERVYDEMDIKPYYDLTLRLTQKDTSVLPDTGDSHGY